MEYQDFSRLKCAMEDVFIGAWDLYTKPVTDNLITQHLHKYSNEKLATADTEESQMEIDSETTTDRRQLHSLIFNTNLEKIFVGNSIALRTL